MNKKNTCVLVILMLSKALYSVCATLPPPPPYDLIKKADSLMYSNPKQSAYYSSLAFNQTKNSTDSVFITEALILHGQAAMLQGDFDVSLGIYYDASDYCPQKAEHLRAKINVRMGMLYCDLRDYSKAFELVDKATSIYKSLNDSTGIALCYNSRGIIHINLSENKMADVFFKNALQINRNRNDRKAVAGNINNLCLYEGNSEEKIAMLNEAIVINKSLNAIWSVSENYNNMGVQLFYAKRYTEALNALQKAKIYAQEINAKELLCDNYRYFSWVYKALQDYKLAYNNLQSLYEMDRELQSEKRLRNIEHDILEKRYLLQQKEAKLKEQNHHILMLQKNIIILLLILCVLIVATYFGVKWYKKRKNLELINARYLLEQSEREVIELKLKQQEKELNSVNTELKSTQHELTNFAFFLKSRNDLLEKIRGMIKEGYRLDQNSIVPHLKKISAFIGQYKNSADGAKEVTEEVEIKNREFIKHLTDKHPDLTPGEKNLATLLRINLSTKEISLLTGVIPKSINMSRYRLRKHLSLESDEDISTYLQGF